jgi:hypothetical protein
MYTLRRFEPYAEPELSCGSQHGDPTWKTDLGADRGVMRLVWARKLSTTPAIHSWLIVQRKCDVQAASCRVVPEGCIGHGECKKKKN